MTRDGTAVAVTAAGRFLLALDRDQPDALLLLVVGPDGSRLEQTFGVLQRDYAIQRIDGLPPKMVTPPPDLEAGWPRSAQR